MNVSSLGNKSELPWRLVYPAMGARSETILPRTNLRWMGCTGCTNVSVQRCLFHQIRWSQIIGGYVLSWFCVCVFAVFSLHLPPLHPPHPEFPCHVLTAGWHPFQPESPPAPPFCRAGRVGPSAEARRSSPVSAVAGPGEQNRKADENSTEGQRIILNLHCLVHFSYFLHFPESLLSPTDENLHLGAGATSEQNNGSSLIFTLWHQNQMLSDNTHTLSAIRLLTCNNFYRGRSRKQTQEKFKKHKLLSDTNREMVLIQLSMWAINARVIAHSTPLVLETFREKCQKLWMVLWGHRFRPFEPLLVPLEMANKSDLPKQPKNTQEGK